MKIIDIMSKRPEIVSPEALLPEVAKKMSKSDSGSVLVSADDKVVGVIAEQDVAVRCVAEDHHPAETTAKQIMTTEVLYCHEQDEAEEVADKMSRDRVRSLSVLNDKEQMVGTVVLGDLVATKKTKELH